MRRGALRPLRCIHVGGVHGTPAFTHTAVQILLFERHVGESQGLCEPWAFFWENESVSHNHKMVPYIQGCGEIENLLFENQIGGFKDDAQTVLVRIDVAYV